MMTGRQWADSLSGEARELLCSVSVCPQNHGFLVTGQGSSHTLVGGFLDSRLSLGAVYSQRAIGELIDWNLAYLQGRGADEHLPEFDGRTDEDGERTWCHIRLTSNGSNTAFLLKAIED
jgi:hypothetical protein